MTDNLHPADELFRLRAEKTAIEVRIDELRQIILELPAHEREGREAWARVVLQRRRDIDRKAIEAEMGSQWLKQRTTERPLTVVRVERLDR